MAAHRPKARKTRLYQSVNICMEIATHWRVLATLLKARAIICIEVATLLNQPANFCMEVAALLNQSAIICIEITKF